MEAVPIRTVHILVSEEEKERAAKQRYEDRQVLNLKVWLRVSETHRAATGMKTNCWGERSVSELTPALEVPGSALELPGSFWATFGALPLDRGLQRTMCSSCLLRGGGWIHTKVKLPPYLISKPRAHGTITWLYSRCQAPSHKRTHVSKVCKAARPHWVTPSRSGPSSNGRHSRSTLELWRHSDYLRSWATCCCVDSCIFSCSDTIAATVWYARKKLQL